MPKWLILFEPDIGMMGVSIFFLFPIFFALYVALARICWRASCCPTSLILFLLNPFILTILAWLTHKDFSLAFFVVMSLLSLINTWEVTSFRNIAADQKQIVLLPPVMTILWYFIWLVAEASIAV